MAQQEGAVMDGEAAFTAKDHFQKFLAEGIKIRSQKTWDLILSLVRRLIFELHLLEPYLL